MAARKPTRPSSARRVPRVRIARPAGRPFQLRYFDPATGREVRLSLGSRDEDEAQRRKAELEAKLLLGLSTRQPATVRGPAMSWEFFRQEYSRLKLATMRDNTAASTENRLDVCERIIRPRTLADMAEPEALERLKAELLVGSEGKGKPRSPHTCNSYLAALVAALNWGHKQRWLAERVAKQEVPADEPDKGRGLAGEEFERMLAACDKVCPRDPESWRYLLRGLWASGLRLSEAMDLSWDLPGTIQVVADRRGVVLQIPGRSQKNRRTQTVPTTPEFQRLLEEHPTKAGWVFTPAARNGGSPRLSAKQVGRILSKLGRTACIAVNAKGKPASGHDLRRSFGQRLADAGVNPRDLRAVMRHADLKTTERFYLREQAHDIGDRLAERLGTTVPTSEAKAVVPGYSEAENGASQPATD